MRDGSTCRRQPMHCERAGGSTETRGKCRAVASGCACRRRSEGEWQVLQLPRAAILRMKKDWTVSTGCWGTSTVVFVTTLIGLVAGAPASAQAPQMTEPTDSCFDVSRPLSGETVGSILINHCTGRTWILVGSSYRRHSDRAGFRWVPIVTADLEANAPALSHRVQTPKDPNAKCFTFNRRQYCE